MGDEFKVITNKAGHRVELRTDKDGRRVAQEFSKEGFLFKETIWRKSTGVNTEFDQVTSLFDVEDGKMTRQVLKDGSQYILNKDGSYKKIMPDGKK